MAVKVKTCNCSNNACFRCRPLTLEQRKTARENANKTIKAKGGLHLVDIGLGHYHEAENIPKPNSRFKCTICHKWLPSHKYQTIIGDRIDELIKIGIKYQRSKKGRHQSKLQMLKRGENDDGKMLAHAKKNVVKATYSNKRIKYLHSNKHKKQSSQQFKRLWQDNKYRSKTLKSHRLYRQNNPDKWMASRMRGINTICKNRRRNVNIKLREALSIAENNKNYSNRQISLAMGKNSGLVQNYVSRYPEFKAKLDKIRSKSE